MHSRQRPTEERLALERRHFTTSEKRLYVKQSPWSKRRETYFGISMGVLYQSHGQISVHDVEFPDTILAEYENLDAMLVDWVKL